MRKFHKYVLLLIGFETFWGNVVQVVVFATLEAARGESQLEGERQRVQYICRESQVDAKPINRRLDLILYHSH